MLNELYILPILLFSVIVHELAHGWMALRLGDPTARDMGRLTFNPIPHIDPVGSIFIPLFSILVAGRVFIAWAKPVPVNPLNFSRYRRDDIFVSVVGPLSNIVMAFACTIIFILLAHIAPVFSESNVLVDEAMGFLLKMFAGGITLNVVLAVFNMIPVPPLDGSHVVASLLPESLSRQYSNVGFFGIFIILMLMRWQPFNIFFSDIIGMLTYPFEMIIHFFV
jgi:Zn-dependent protease